MATPRVPGSGDTVEFPCGETVSENAFDLGMRTFDCDCGDRHAVVMDVHPLTRFVPEFFVAVLRETIETDDEFEEFSTAHLLAMVRQEFPEKVVCIERAEDGHVGFALLWVATFDARRLHEIVVELLLELVDHAVSHADDEESVAALEDDLHAFDVEQFVTEYRRERDFEDEYDSMV